MVLVSVSDFAEIFSENFNLDDSSIQLLALVSRTNLKLHNNHVIPEIIRRLQLILTPPSH